MTDSLIRISDADRDSALSMLNSHRMAGRLTDDELTERLGQLRAARTRSDLRTLFADLPDPHPLPRAAPPPMAHGSPTSGGDSPWPTMELPDPRRDEGPTAGGSFPIYEPGGPASRDDQTLAPGPPPVPPRPAPPTWLSYIWLAIPAAILLTMVTRGNSWVLIPIAVIGMIVLKQRYGRS